MTWSPDGKRIAAAGASLRTWDVSMGEPLWIALEFAEGNIAVLSNAGELIHCDPGAEKELVYIIEKPTGQVELLTPTEFRKRIAR